jgi:hypothetical protein
VAQHFGLSVRWFVPFRRFILALALPLVLALISGHAVAQATPGVSIGQTFNGETATPIPGGHDYIHLLSETVNTSNGSLAFNIQLPMPKGRGISLPYTLMYNSAGLYHLGQDYSGNLTFVPTDLKADSIPWVSWSESSFVPIGPTCPPSCTQPPPFSQCNVANGFVFNDPSGTSHNLALGVAAQSANASEPPGALPCPISGTGGETAPSSQGGTGDGKVWARFTSPNTSGLSVTAVQHWSVNYGSNPNVNGPVGPFTVTDEAGTTYFFDGNGTYDYANQVNWEPPSQIEDRNGNIISGVTDTLGRPMWQSASGGVNIGGLVYPPATCVGSCSGSNPVNYQVPSHLGWNGMSYLPGDTSVLCPTSTAIMSVSASSPSGIGAFALPTNTSSNPQQYNFYYGGNTNGGTANPYGLLNEVTYPDGGWVKYTWQMSNSPSVLISGSSPYSEMGAFEGQGQTSPGVYSGNPYPSACLIYYSTPVLASRVVSYDGVNTAQTQTFSYSTIWGSGGQSGYDWTTKQTQVITTDNVTGASYLTVYNYGPTVPPSGTTPFSVGGVAAEIPVERSVLYYSGASTGSPLLRTVTKSWFDMFHLAEEDTTENGLTSKTVNSYQAPSPTSPFTLLTGKSEYDFGASTPTQTTAINYKTFAPNTITYQSNSVTIPVPSQPSSVIISNSSGPVAETDYGYDSYGSGLASVTAVQHDGTNYGAGMTNRGNLTSMTKKCVNCTNATTTYMYDLTGQPASMTDPCGNATCSDMTGASHTTTYSFRQSFGRQSRGQLKRLSD